MKRRIKFRAYIPKLDIMVYKISLLCNGDIEVDEDYLSDKLVETGKRIFIKHDHDREGNDCVMERISEDDYITLLPLTSLDYGRAQIYKNNCVINLNTGIVDSNYKQIYESDIVEISRPSKFYDPDEESSEIVTRAEVVNINDKQLTYDWNGENGKPMLASDYLKMHNYTSDTTVIGNIYQHKHLLTKSK